MPLRDQRRNGESEKCVVEAEEEEWVYAFWALDGLKKKYKKKEEERLWAFDPNKF